MSGRSLPGQAALDPPLTKVAGRSPSGTVSVSPDPLLTPSENHKAVPIGRRFCLARPRYCKQSLKSPFEAKNPQAMAAYVPEVARLTYKTGSNKSP